MPGDRGATDAPDLFLAPADVDAVVSALPAWLLEQRWFAGKGRTVTAVRVCRSARLAAGVPVHHLVVGVELDGEAWQTYQVPVAVRSQSVGSVVARLGADRWVVDALTDPLAMTALLAHASAAPELDPNHSHGGAGGAQPPGPLLQIADRGVPGVTPWGELTPRRLAVEQSNTSMALGDVALVKVFRLLVAGVNPDIEVHAALGSVGCDRIARCLGWVNGAWRDPADGLWRTGHLAMVQELVNGAVDGWDLARERVSAGTAFSDEARDLGRATGRVHRDLRRALPAHLLDDDEVRALVQRLHARLSHATSIVPELEPLGAGLHAKVAALSQVGELTVQRVHGDYHLGQVLLSGDGWKLLDFEGEPGGSIAARTALDHPLRDVAGMLRSFAYAGAQGGSDRPPDEVAAWQQDCERAFLAGYAEEGSADPGADDAILEAYLVDKAAYEAAYEKRNRPDWLAIPLRALTELAG